MRLANLAVSQQLSQVCSDCDLPGMRTRRVNAFVKSDRRAFQRFECHCAGDISEANESFGAMKRERADCAHRLRSVEKRQAFFHFQLQRRNLRALESLGCRQTLAVVKASPSPIAASARCASGARSPLAPTLPFSGITGVTPFSSIAISVSITSGRAPLNPAREHVCAQQQHRARFIFRQRITQTARVTAHQVQLQLQQVRLRRYSRLTICRSRC